MTAQKAVEIREQLKEIRSALDFLAEYLDNDKEARLKVSEACHVTDAAEMLKHARYCLDDYNTILYRQLQATRLEGVPLD